MLYIVTYFEAQPNFADVAARAIGNYRARCSNGGGNVQTEALRELARSNRFVVLETWLDEGAFKEHESSEATRAFRDEFMPMQSGPADQRIHQGLALTPAAKAADPRSLFVVTHIDVPPPRKDETEVLLKTMSERAVNDAGNQRYDVLQQTSRPNHFTAVSLWGTESAFHAHMAAAHTRQFRQTLGPMSGALYDERLYRLLE